MHRPPAAAGYGARRLKARSIRLAAAVCCLLVTAVPGAFAQTNLQLWGNVTLDWARSERLGDPAERFANKQRIRTGFGFRRSFSWRFEILYMWTRSRDTVQEGFKTNDNSINFRLKRVF